MARIPNATSFLNIKSGKQIRSLANLSTEKMYKQSYFDETGIKIVSNEEFKPCTSNFKIPILSDQLKQLSQQVEVLRQTRSKNVALIEERLLTFTKNANMNTTSKK